MTITIPEDEQALPVRRLPVHLKSDERRVITRPFTYGGAPRLTAVIERVNRLNEDEVARALNQVLGRFKERHQNIIQSFRDHYQMAADLTGLHDDMSEERKLLIGSFFTMEYSMEAAALFNPSIVAHPDQHGAEEGALRFIMSLRATGEGHLSSVVFRTGQIDPKGEVWVAAPPKHMAPAKLAPDQYYLKELFRRKLGEMSGKLASADLVLQRLGGQFTLGELERAIEEVRQMPEKPVLFQEAVQSMLWLARSNYKLQLPDDADVSTIVLFPQSESEQRGIEDLRLVRFTEDDGTATYYGTYAAYDGYRVLPMLMETSDFRSVAVHTLNGAAVRDKGLALFPRKVGGHYVMCSRLDTQNLFIMYSDYVHFWESAEMLAAPQYPWEMMHIGNCGSPLETPEGWLLITHGVGPMRRYCIGAMLLDLEDPMKVIGRLPDPLIAPQEDEREGYTPNVVYSCGALIHNEQVFIPYAMSDRYTSVASVPLDQLVNRLLDSPA